MNEIIAIAEILENLKKDSSNIFLNITEILINLIGDILSDENNLAFRTIFLNSDIFNKLLAADGAVECLFLIGFHEDDDKLVLSETNLDRLDELFQLLLQKREPVFQQRENCNLLKIGNEFLLNVQNRFNQALVYKDICLLNEARKVVPLTELQSKSEQRVQQIVDSEEERNKELISIKNGFSEYLLYELLIWFKRDFFSWVNSPECEICQSKTTLQDTIIVNSLRVEQYICAQCTNYTKFTRHTNPGVLLRTRRGRCGEWANAFTLICSSLGWDARYVLDETDHVWTEIYSEAKQRWLHCDACETALDTPLMYEVGWKKQLTYVIACSPEEVQDVTWRYSQNHRVTLTRRRRCSEIELVQLLIELRAQRQRHLSEERKNYLQMRTVQELIQFLQENQITEGDKKERESGSLMWRITRGEASNSKLVSYTWKPIDLLLKVRYSPVSDKYQQLDNNGDIKKELIGWQSAIYKAENVFRKEEFDWKIVYIARKENSSRGVIVWKFSVPEEKPSIRIDTIEIQLNYKTFENGRVRIRLTDNISEMRKELFLTTNNDEIKYSTKKFSGCKEVYLVAELFDGRGDHAWQHAQLFRQSFEKPSNLFPFIVNIQFVENK